MPTSSGVNERSHDGCAYRDHDHDRVDAVRLQLPDPEIVDQLAETFGLLSDPNRLRLLTALLHGEMCVCDLAAACRQSESGVSHALRLLRAHRVVVARRSGRRAYYRLADAHVRMLVDLALSHSEHAVPLTRTQTEGVA